MRGFTKAVVLGGVLLASIVHAREVAGRRLPERTSMSGRTLALNGAAVQRKLIFDIYSVALYLETPTRNADEALKSDEHKRLVLTLLRNASRTQVASQLRKDLQATAPNFEALAPRVERLLAAIPDMASGETITVSYAPDKGTTLQNKAGHSTTVEGKDFAEAFFGIWLRERPAMSRVRHQLLNGH
jgi:hypothetical protein